MMIKINTIMMLTFKKRFLKLLFKVCLVSSLFNSAAANSVVCMQSTLGDVCLELYDESTPITVENFLNYVNNNDYNNTLIHRSVPGFVLQGGAYNISEELVVSAIGANEAIENEYKLSNTRGTIAMAKVADDPDSATNQWFINLADNSTNLDNQNGGFTVFGRVIGNGMDVIDNIASQQRFNFNSTLTETPTINYSGGEDLIRDNFVFINTAAQLIEDDEIATYQNNYIIAVVDAGSLGIFNCKFKLTQSSPIYQFELDLSLISAASSIATVQATFDNSTGLLTIPSIRLSETNTLNNVILQLSDSGQYLFSLLSINE